MKLTKTQCRNRHRLSEFLQSSVKFKKGLRPSLDTNNRCCLGVALEDICGVSPNATLNCGMPNLAQRELLFLMLGIHTDECQALANVNDGTSDIDPNVLIFELEHPDIGLYFDLTAEAGEVHA